MKSYRHPRAAVTTVRILAKTLPPGRAEKCHCNYYHCFSCFGVVSPAPIFKNCLCCCFFFLSKAINSSDIMLSLSHLKSFVNALHALRSSPGSSRSLACLSYTTGRGDVILNVYGISEPRAVQQWHCTEARVGRRAGKPCLPQPHHLTGSRATLGSQLWGEDAVSLTLSSSFLQLSVEQIMFLEFIHMFIKYLLYFGLCARCCWYSGDSDRQAPCPCGAHSQSRGYRDSTASTHTQQDN